MFRETRKRLTIGARFFIFSEGFEKQANRQIKENVFEFRTNFRANKFNPITAESLHDSHLRTCTAARTRLVLTSRPIFPFARVARAAFSRPIFL